MLDFAVAMTHDSYKMEEEDLAPLRAEGLSDEGIAEVAQVAAMFNFTNRMANALGWRPNEHYYSDFR